ncbi:hypothetical protein SAMN05444920_12667 [Nonomuraea solani]|uniref:Uncharacterized protein n=1 Tax=Nonomuraea solani TaxID=1144553 RepID=A0A1H6EZV9_9ACTN|nr:hypothetical protein [Nonomuraea solani]SEH02409.1 hypothetical protein SAMN05444920_12667 [Nonomuraea solani]
MEHPHQPDPQPPSPPGGPGSIIPARDIGADQAGQERRLVDHLTAEKITAVRHAFYTAAAKAIFALQNGQRLSSEQLFVTVHAQAARAWWDRVDEEITGKRLTCDHALRRMRSWARHYLTGEPPAARPGTLFDHALAHAARIAARDFLTDSGHLLTQHLINQAATTTPATAAPVDHDHPGLVTPAPPASTVAGP